jgi:hypothetical protein
VADEEERQRILERAEQRCQSAKEINERKLHRHLPLKSKQGDYLEYMSVMTHKLKVELGKQIRLQKVKRDKNQLRDSFSETRELFKDLSAQPRTAENMLFMQHLAGESHEKELNHQKSTS